MAEGQPIDGVIITQLPSGEFQAIASTPDAARRVKELFTNVNEGTSPEYQMLHDEAQEQLHVETHVFHHAGFGNPTRLESETDK